MPVTYNSIYTTKNSNIPKLAVKNSAPQFHKFLDSLLYTVKPGNVRLDTAVKKKKKSNPKNRLENYGTLIKYKLKTGREAEGWGEWCGRLTT